MKDDFVSLKHSLQNISSTNTDLGIYHLYNQNYNDAILRFKIAIFFSKDLSNTKLHYWLGLTYFLKCNYEKSLENLHKAENQDHLGLIPFIKSIDSAENIPDHIYKTHRSIKAKNFRDSFISHDLNIPEYLVLKLLENIEKLPKKYKILDLGSNTGLLSHEVSKRMPEEYEITGVEISDKMIEMQSTEIYSKNLCAPIQDFLARNSEKYEIICSLNGFSFNLSLKNIFKDIRSALKPSGYFAFVIRNNNENIILKDELEFVYNHKEIKDTLANSGFTILMEDNFVLEIKNNYSIFVCKR